MKDNRDNFKSGGKPFSRDAGYTRDKNKDGGGRKKYGDRPKPPQNKPYKKRYEDRNADNNPRGFRSKSDYSPKNQDKPEGKFVQKFSRPERPFVQKSERKPGRNFEKKFGGDGRDNKKFEGKPAVQKRAEPERTQSDEYIRDSGMVYGRNAVLELLKSGKTIDKLFVQSGQREGSITKIFSEAVKAGVPVLETEKAKLDSMINSSSHQGVIAMASEKEYCALEDILKIAEERGEKPFILIADKIMDPHNLGAIIRTAECAGVHGIVIPKRRAAGVSSIVSKTSAGASVHMAIAKVANIANAVEELKNKNIWIFSSYADSNISEENTENINIKNYADADYSMPLALVVGNEGEGLSPVIIQKSDFVVKIPMSGKIESLNVSCASAVLMYEAARQRRKIAK